MEKEEKENREKNEQQTQSPSRQKAGKLVNERMKDKSPERGTSRKKGKKKQHTHTHSVYKKTIEKI